MSVAGAPRDDGAADNRPRAQSRRQLQPSRQRVWIWRAGFLQMKSAGGWIRLGVCRVVALFADLSINILLFGFKVVDLRC